MKKVLVGVLMVILTLCTLVGCTIKPVNPGGNNDTPKGDLASAKAALNVMYYGAGPVFVGDIERTSVVNVKGNLYPVTWTTDATEGVEIGEVNEETATVVIHLTQSKDHDINFKLIATITDPATGETITAEYNYTIARWKENTFAEYLAAAAGDPVVVKGIVSGIMSTQLGDSYNGIYFDDGIGGYYAYDCEDPIAKGVEVGMEIRVSGLKDIYSGTHEIKDGVVEILNSEKKELAPVDFTELYANAADIKEAALVEPQALLVTIKGVTIGGQDTSNGYYYFSLGGLESYVRISGSMCPLNAADTAAFKEFHSEHFGYTADVTGVICVFSGAFYLTPVTADAFSNVKMPELDAAGKVAFEKENLEIVTSIKKAGEVELPAIGKTFTDVTIAWASNNEAFPVSADGKLSVVLPEEETTIVLTATITCGSAIETKEIEVSIAAAAKFEYTATPITEAQEGTFKYAIWQNGLEKVLYFDGGISSSEYLTTTEDPAAAADVVIKAVEGGYTLQAGDKYIEIYTNTAGKVRPTLVEAPTSVWAWNEEAKVFTMNVGEKIYYLGTYNTFNTFSASETWRITGEKAGDVDVSQFPGRFVTLTAKEIDTTPVKTVAELKEIPAEDEMKEIYKVTGTVKSWRYSDSTDGTQYGNFYVEDETGDILVYGATATEEALSWDDAAGKYVFNNPKDFLSNELTSTIKIGDTVTLKVVKTNYKGTAQLNAIVVEVVPAQGGEVVPPVENEEPAVIENITIAELIAIAAENEMKQAYTVTATVKAWRYSDSTDGTKYGNLYIQDETGEILVYGATATESALVWNATAGKYSFSNPQDYLTNATTSAIVIGDTVTLKVVKTSYNGTAQLNAIVVSVGEQGGQEPPVVEPPVEEVVDTIAELKAIATADEMTEVYTITATVSKWRYNDSTDGTKYGNFYIKDATGEILVYGATATESALVLADGKYTYSNKQDFLTNELTKNIKIGDVVTLKVVRTNYNGTAQLNAIVVSVTAHTCDANTVLEAVEAGCETVGYTAGTACSVCGAVQSGHEEVEATGHNYVNGVCTGCGAQQPTADTVTATITFDDKAKRTEFDTNHQVWVENGITITNNKASSTSNVADYVKPARFYKGSELIIAVEGGITKIEITVNSYDTNKYAQAIKAGVSNGTVTVSGQVVTIILDGSASSITISLAANQARVDSITVTYNG